MRWRCANVANVMRIAGGNVAIALFQYVIDVTEVMASLADVDEKSFRKHFCFGFSLIFVCCFWFFIENYKISI